MALIFSATLGALPPAAPAATKDRWTGNKGQFQAQLEATKRAISRKNPSALAQLYRLWNTTALTRSTDEFRKALGPLVAARRIDPLVKDHLNFILGDLYLSAGDRASSLHHRNRLGLATDGWIIGPFENSGNSGHSTSYPPESRFEADQDTPGKTYPVRWRRIQGLAPTGEIMLSHLITPNENATAYALFAVRSKANVRGALRIGASDQVKVFYDGSLIYEFDGKRGPDFDQINIPIVIKKGAHKLLIKSSWSSARSKILVRITHPRGGKIKGVQIDGDLSTIETAYRKSLKAPKARHSIEKPEVQINKAVQKARGKKKAEVLGLRADLYTLMSLFDQRSLPTPPQTDLAQAITLKPNDPLLRFYYAIRIQANNRPLAREQLEAALNCDPKHAPSLLKLADIAEAAGKRAEARQYLERVLKSDPDFSIAHTVIAEHRFKNSFEKESAFFKLQQRCRRITNSHCLSTLSRMAIKLGNIASGRKLAKEALGIDASKHRLRYSLAHLAFRAKRHQELDSLLESARSLWPYRSSYYFQHAQYLRGRGATNKAISLLDQAINNFPGETRLLGLRTEIALTANNTQKATALLRRNLLIDPGQTKVRKKYDQLRGQKSGIEDLVDEDIRKLSQHPPFEAEKEFGAIYLADKQVIQLYQSGQTSRVNQYAIRLHKAELDKVISSQRIYFTPGREHIEILAAERLTANGQLIPADRITESGPRGKVAGTYIDQRWKVIQFKKLRPGDTINIRYRVDSIGPNIFGGFFGNISNAQAGFPKNKVSRVILAPKSRPLYTAQLRAPEPKRSEDKDQQKIEWFFEHLEGLEHEPSAPPYTNRATIVSVSTYPSWSELGAWYSKLIGPQFELDDDARNAGRNAVKGVDNAEEKIRRLYAYVVKNTRYVGIELGIHGWKPFKASETHQRRYGDCKDKATLLAALLKDNGVDATVALVRTFDRGHLPKDHASMWAFNHAITYVPSVDLFLDGTAEFSGTRELPYMDQDGQALIVWPDGRTEKRRIPQSPAEANTHHSEYEARISQSGQLHLLAKEKLEGAFAPQTRKQHEAPERRQVALETRLGRSLPGTKVISSKFLYLDELETPPEIHYEAKLNKFGNKDGKKLTIPLNLFEVKFKQAFAPLPKRTLDVHMNYPWSARSRLRYIFPAGSVLKELPKDRIVDNPYIRLEQRFEKTADGLTVTTHGVLKSKHIPLKDYEAFRNACAEIDKVLGARVRISL